MKVIRVLLFLVAFITLQIVSNAQKPVHTFTLGTKDFLLDGKALQIVAGEMHYQRIPQDYWQHRLRLLHAMGCNAVSVYCFWNDHEPVEGRFDFKSGNRYLAKFVQLAQQEGLWVILRPGPYACAEWEFGGYPWWLLKQKDMLVRSRDPRFQKAAAEYIKEIGKQVGNLQITQGGPIIMVQVENEYGSFGDDKLFMRENADMYSSAGFEVPFFTADGSWQCHAGYLPGILPALNGEYNPLALRDTVNKYHNGKGPYFVPEFYPGWLDHWAEKKSVVPVGELLPDVERLLSSGASLSFYMLHGGTNFGFMNGANYSKDFPIQPDLTSYDYDAPITEAGWPTEKYYELKYLISKYLPKEENIPQVPENNPVIEIPAVKLNQVAYLFNNLGKPVVSDNLMTFEDLDQGYGFVLYRTSIEQKGKFTLRIDELRDYAQIYVDGKYVSTLQRRLKQDSIVLEFPKANTQLDILVENLGRINYGKKMTDNYKGITRQVTLNGEKLLHWQMFRLPMDHVDDLKFEKKTVLNVPAFKKSKFTLQKIGDTFLDMSTFGKGVVWVNGHNLGRYWNAGPQQTLYCPAPFLRTGTNELVVFEMENNSSMEICGRTKPVLDQLKIK